MNEDDVQDYQEKLGTEVGDGGGCAEAWEATGEIRGSSAGCCGSANRRSVLRSTLIGLVGSIAGFAGIGGATEPEITREELKNKAAEYPTSASIADAFRSDASNLLTALAEKDIINSPTIDEFDIEQASMKEAGDYPNMKEGVISLGIPYQDQAAVKLYVRRQFGQFDVQLAGYPELDHYFAIVHSEASSGYVIVDPDGPKTGNVSELRSTSQDISTSGCLQGGCCTVACDSGACYCVYDNFECCDGVCYDQPNDSCSGCSDTGCHCDCP